MVSGKEKVENHCSKDSCYHHEVRLSCQSTSRSLAPLPQYAQFCDEQPLHDFPIIALVKISGWNIELISPSFTAITCKMLAWFSTSFTNAKLWCCPKAHAASIPSFQLVGECVVDLRTRNISQMRAIIPRRTPSLGCFDIRDGIPWNAIFIYTDENCRVDRYTNRIESSTYFFMI